MQRGVGGRHAPAPSNHPAQSTRRDLGIKHHPDLFVKGPTFCHLIYHDVHEVRWREYSA